MKVEYSIWKFYIAIMLPIGLSILALLWSFPNIIIGFFFALGGVASFPFAFIFTQTFNFEMNENGLNRKWMAHKEQELAWEEFKPRKLPFMTNSYWLSSKISYFKFPLLPSFLMSNAKAFSAFLEDKESK